jgi:hypothetical protein
MWNTAGKQLIKSELPTGLAVSPGEPAVRRAEVRGVCMCNAPIIAEDQAIAHLTGISTDVASPRRMVILILISITLAQGGTGS